MTVSVIVAAYNGEKYVGDMLESLMFQIRKPDEIVCVDDGSTDGTLAVLKKYAKKHPFIKVHSIPNGGAAAARIYGFLHSTGEAVCFVDCDDTVDPDYISSLHDALVEKNADVAVGGYAREKDNGDLIHCEMMRTRPEIDAADESINQINTALFNKMIRRECIAEDITLPRIVQGDDLCYWCRILPLVKTITFVPKPMYHYIVREGSQMAKFRADSFALMVEEMISSVSAMKGTLLFDSVFGIFFISLCISQLARYYGEDKAAAKAEYKRLKALFDEKLPGWRKTAMMNLGTAWRTRGKGLAIWVCGKLFAWGMFPLYMAGMDFMMKKLHWKAKW